MGLTSHVVVGLEDAFSVLAIFQCERQFFFFLDATIKRAIIKLKLQLKKKKEHTVVHIYKLKIHCETMYCVVGFK